MAFGMKRLSFDTKDHESDHYDYTLGLGFGDRSSATGISYSWTRGGWPYTALDGSTIFFPSDSQRSVLNRQAG